MVLFNTTSLLPKLALLTTVAFSGWVDLLGAIKCPSVGDGGENGGGTGVWVLPRNAAPNSAQYAFDGVDLKDSDGQSYSSPGHAWVRVDNHLVLFYLGTFIGVHLDYFDPTRATSDTLDETLTDIGEWERTA